MLNEFFFDLKWSKCKNMKLSSEFKAYPAVMSYFKSHGEMMGEYCPVEMSFIVGKSTCCKNKNFCTGQPEEDFESNYDLG